MHFTYGHFIFIDVRFCTVHMGRSIFDRSAVAEQRRRRRVDGMENGMMVGMVSRLDLAPIQANLDPDRSNLTHPQRLLRYSKQGGWGARCCRSARASIGASPSPIPPGRSGGYPMAALAQAGAMAWPCKRPRRAPARRSAVLRPSRGPSPEQWRRGSGPSVWCSRMRPTRVRTDGWRMTDASVPWITLTSLSV